VRLGLAAADGSGLELSADHVIAATGYRPDVTRLPFLGSQIVSGLRTLAGTPIVGRHYQASVPGLHFIGPAVAPTFGPVMRFVYGARHAAIAVTRQLASTGAGRPRTSVTTGRRPPQTGSAAR